MAKNIVICCDGTGQKVQFTSTNVVRLVQALNCEDPQRQICCYDPGVGTLPDPAALTGAAKLFTKVAGLAVGYGLLEKVGSLYGFLIDHYNEGDQIYLFGFSRGAFTARALGGLLYRFRVLKPEHRNLIPYALELYRKHYERLTDPEPFLERDALFRRLFSRPLESIAFLGLWDTVKSYGYFRPVSLPHTRHNPLVRTVRHALSLDERRSFFGPTSWGGVDNPDGAGDNPQDPKVTGQDVQEVWFAGFHSDVGGGLTESESGLARYSLRWMLDEAQQAGLLLNAAGRNHVLPDSPAERAARGAWLRAHPSHTGLWRLSEFVPRLELVNVPLPPRPILRFWPTGKRDPKKFLRNGKVLVHTSVKNVVGGDKRYKFDANITEYVGREEPRLDHK